MLAWGFFVLGFFFKYFFFLEGEVEEVEGLEIGTGLFEIPIM